MNAKLGGTNAAPHLPKVTEILKQQDIMVVGTWMILIWCPHILPKLGADVTHPSPGVYGEPSFASVVSSTNPMLTRYATFLSIQSPRMEPISELKDMMKVIYSLSLSSRLNFDEENLQKAIKAWSAAMNKPIPPRRIFFYRDGVSEGEYDSIKNFEVPAIRGILSAVATRTPSKLLF